MTVVGVRDLAKRASAIVDGVAVNNESAIITKRGKPVAVLLPIDSDRLEDHLLATAPEFLAATAGADIELQLVARVVDRAELERAVRSL